MVDYSDLENLKVKMIKTPRFLHDGGFESTGRYFMDAANASDKIAVIDTKEGKLAAVVPSARRRTPVVAQTSCIRSSARSGRPATSATKPCR
jgi:nitrite reductase (NO-forming)/hydroxylamine reductase